MPELHFPWAHAPVRQTPEGGGSSTQTTCPVEIGIIKSRQFCGLKMFSGRKVVVSLSHLHRSGDKLYLYLLREASRDFMVLPSGSITSWRREM